MEFVTLVETEIVAADVENVQLIEVVATEVVGGDVTVIETVDVGTVEVVTDRLVQIEILEFSPGPPGPPGPPGVSEDEMMYAKRVDMVSDNLLYRGEAVVGSPTSAAAWRVRRITIGVDGDVTEEWAGGNASFDKTWDGRLGYTYS